MAQPSLPHGLPTVKEYLEMEETATVRQEYVGGMIYAWSAQPGGTTG